MRVEVTAYDDRTFTYTQKLPATSYFLKLAAGVEKGASSPGHETVASVSAKQVYEIAKIKQVRPRSGDDGDLFVLQPYTCLCSGR